MTTQARGRAAPLDDELRRALVDAVGAAERPLSAKKVRDRLPENRRRSEKAISVALAELAKTNAIHAVRGHGTSYTAVDPIVTARNAIVSALANEPRSKTRARDTARAETKLPESVVERAFAGLVAEKKIFLHPKLGALSVRFGTAPPDPGPYLARPVAALRDLERLLAGAGVTGEAWRAALGDALSPWLAATATATATAAADGVTDDGESLLAAMRDLTATKGEDALLSIRQLRSLRALDKQRFDRALLRLQAEGRVDLHYHDFPDSLAAEERRQLVEDDRGVVYVGAVLRGRP